MRASRYNSLPQLAIVMAGFTLTLMLLESAALEQWAQRLEASNAAILAIETTARVHRILQPLHIEQVREDALNGLDRLGWTDDPARLQAAQRTYASVGPSSLQSCAANPVTASLAQPNHSLAALPHGIPIALAPAVPTLTPLPQLPPVADGHPRVLALAGDSMMAVGLSDVLLRATAADPNVRVIKAFRSGTGLARPDVFDWMQEYPAMIGGEHPAAVIVAIGANDGQGFVQDGRVDAFGTGAWVQAYQDRVAAFLHLVTQNGATVVWVGLPPMKSAQYNEKTAEINRIAYSVVSKTPNAIWWNPQPYVADQSGAYREFLTPPDGRTMRLRAPDGIHLSDEGAMLLSPALINWLNAPPPALVAQAAPPSTAKAQARKASMRKIRH